MGNMFGTRNIVLVSLLIGVELTAAARRSSSRSTYKPHNAATARLQAALAQLPELTYDLIETQTNVFAKRAGRRLGKKYSASIRQLQLEIKELKESIQALTNGVEVNCAGAYLRSTCPSHNAGKYARSTADGYRSTGQRGISKSKSDEAELSRKIRPSNRYGRLGQLNGLND